MRNFLRCSLVLLLATGLATAGELEKKQAAQLPAENPTRGLLDCTGAVELFCGDVDVAGDNTGDNVITNYGCTTLGYAGNGETVFFFTLASEQSVTIFMHDFTPDLDLFLLGSCDEEDCLAYSAGVSDETVSACLAAGTYYVVVDGYGSTLDGNEGAFLIDLTCEDCPESFGETCEDATDLCALAGEKDGTFSFGYSTLGTSNDYTYNNCGGYSANGGDIVFVVCLEAGGTIDVTQSGDYDMSLYLVTDCADLYGTCVDGTDNCCTGADEFVNYTSVAGGTYYLIVDGYSTSGSGTLSGSVTGCCPPTATESDSWGGVKALFR